MGEHSFRGLTIWADVSFPNIFDMVGFPDLDCI